MSVSVSPLDFQALTDSAKKIAEERSRLQAEQAALSKQIQDIQASLVQEYGENYMTMFNEAVNCIQAWDAAHVAS